VRDKDDPKQLIEPANALNWSRTVQERIGAWLIESVRAIRAHPDFSTAHGVLASMEHDTGNLPEAIETPDTIAPRRRRSKRACRARRYLQESGGRAIG
jgi:hypothetical protein